MFTHRYFDPWCSWVYKYAEYAAYWISFFQIFFGVRRQERNCLTSPHHMTVQPQSISYLDFWRKSSQGSVFCHDLRKYFLWIFTEYYADFHEILCEFSRNIMRILVEILTSYYTFYRDLSYVVVSWCPIFRSLMWYDRYHLYEKHEVVGEVDPQCEVGGVGAVVHMWMSIWQNEWRHLFQYCLEWVFMIWCFYNGPENSTRTFLCSL